MSYSCDANQLCLVVDFIDHTVLADPDAIKTLMSLELPAISGTWGLLKRPYNASNTPLNVEG
jgi:hypothetical protein